MRLRVAVFGTLGALATAGAAILVFAPDLVLIPPTERVVAVLTSRDPRGIMLAGTALIGVYVLFAARSTGGTTPLDPVRGADRSFEATVDNPPESVTDDRRQLTAESLDGDIDAAVSRGGRPLRQVRDTLSLTAASAYASREGTSLEDARAIIDAGAWTENETAAAFLGGETGPRPSIYSRIRLWLLPAAERRRRIEQTIRAIGDLQEAPL